MRLPVIDDKTRAAIARAIESWRDLVLEHPEVTTCSLCNGKGKVVVETGLVSIQASGRVKIGREKLTCPRCEGSGKAGRFSYLIEINSEQEHPQ